MHDEFEADFAGRPSLCDRVARLERTSQRWRRAAWVSTTLLGLILVLGQARPRSERPGQADPSPDDPAGIVPGDKPVADEVVARGLRIVDEKGITRIECSIAGDLPAIRLFDSTGTTRLRLTADNAWPTMEIDDDRGITRVSIGSSPKGPGILFHAPDKRPRAVLGATDDGPGLVLFDGNRPRVLVGVKNNQPVMAVLNSDSKLTFEAPIAPREPAPPSP